MLLHRRVCDTKSSRKPAVGSPQWHPCAPRQAHVGSLNRSSEAKKVFWATCRGALIRDSGEDEVVKHRRHAPSLFHPLTTKVREDPLGWREPVIFCQCVAIGHRRCSASSRTKRTALAEKDCSQPPMGSTCTVVKKQGTRPKPGTLQSKGNF